MSGTNKNSRTVDNQICRPAARKTEAFAIIRYPEHLNHRLFKMMSCLGDLLLIVLKVKMYGIKLFHYLKNSSHHKTNFLFALPPIVVPAS